LQKFEQDVCPHFKFIPVSLAPNGHSVGPSSAFPRSGRSHSPTIWLWPRSSAMMLVLGHVLKVGGVAQWLGQRSVAGGLSLIYAW